MRVTNQMMANNFLTDMNNNMENLNKLQRQMTSGKEISKPSDDPTKVARAMQLQTDINTNTQYGQNITDASNWLNTTDTSLGQVGDVLQRIRELLVSSGDAAYGSDEQTAIKNEVNQKIGELTQIVNTNYDGRYIFGGSKGTSKPVVEIPDALNSSNSNISYADKNGTAITSASDPISYNMINTKLSTEISHGVSMQYNVTATDIMKINSSTDLSQVFSNITSHLDSGNTSSLTGQDLTDVTDAITNVLRLRSEVGAKSNRMDSAKSKNEDESSNMTEILSNTEDIDITKKTMEYATMQTVYTASLQTSAKVLQPTLMDYLK
jgi:flagellar hook-associated protein 3 FlgL